MKIFLIIPAFILLACCISNRKTGINAPGNTSFIFEKSKNDSLKNAAFPYSKDEFQMYLETYLENINFPLSNLKNRVVSFSLLIDSETGFVSDILSIFSEYPGDEVEKVLAKFIKNLKRFKVDILPKDKKNIFKFSVTLVFNKVGKLLEVNVT